jgi:hypothetical protein
MYCECANCVFFRRLNDVYGECRFHPPTPEVTTMERPTGERAKWPIVKRIDWCGKYDGRVRFKTRDD